LTSGNAADTSSEQAEPDSWITAAVKSEIDQAALDLLAMEQPMAIDLRFILSVIKINGDLDNANLELDRSHKAEAEAHAANDALAARVSALPVETRRTPTEASSAMVGPLGSARTLTGSPTVWTTAAI